MRIFRTITSMRKGSQRGFTLLEAVVTVSVMGILAAVVTPTYLKTQTDAKLVMSKSNIIQLQQGFINLYLDGLFKGETDVWPDEPPDNKMTFAWADATLLYDGRTVSQLYSSSQIIYNPYDHPFLYFLLPETDQERAGIKIDDPDMGISVSFRP